jgi:hypothetical protein
MLWPRKLKFWNLGSPIPKLIKIFNLFQESLQMEVLAYLNISFDVRVYNCGVLQSWFIKENRISSRFIYFQAFFICLNDNHSIFQVLWNVSYIPGRYIFNNSFKILLLYYILYLVITHKFFHSPQSFSAQLYLFYIIFKHIYIWSWSSKTIFKCTCLKKRIYAYPVKTEWGYA